MSRPTMNDVRAAVLRCPEEFGVRDVMEKLPPGAALDAVSWALTQLRRRREIFGTRQNTSGRSYVYRRGAVAIDTAVVVRFRVEAFDRVERVVRQWVRGSSEVAL